MENIQSKEVFEQIIQLFASDIKRIWYQHLKVVNITKHSKDWWNKNCHRDFETCEQYKQIEDQKIFIGMVKKTKCNFFDFQQ